MKWSKEKNSLVLNAAEGRVPSLSSGHVLKRRTEAWFVRLVENAAELGAAEC